MPIRRLNRLRCAAVCRSLVNIQAGDVAFCGGSAWVGGCLAV
jgi:hypothetical protein